MSHLQQWVELPVGDIMVGNRFRRLDHRFAADLAGSMRMIGLIAPLVVRPVHGAYRLVCGLHRLGAAAALDWPSVQCTVFDFDDASAELAEIDENSLRVELSPAERALHVKRRCEILDQIRSGVWTDRYRSPRMALIEIDENLLQLHFGPAEQAMAAARRKVLTKLIKQGAARGA